MKIAGIILSFDALCTRECLSCCVFDMVDVKLIKQDKNASTAVGEVCSARPRRYSCWEFHFPSKPRALAFCNDEIVYYIFYSFDGNYRAHFQSPMRSNADDGANSEQSQSFSKSLRCIKFRAENLISIQSANVEMTSTSNHFGILCLDTRHGRISMRFHWSSQFQGCQL